MTLIIGLIAEDRIVLGADGAEFRHDPGQPKYMHVVNRKKLFPIPGRSVVISISGLNRLPGPNRDMAFSAQPLISDVLSLYFDELAQIETIQGIAHRIKEILQDDIEYILEDLSKGDKELGFLRITVFGFDFNETVPHVFEQTWEHEKYSGVMPIVVPEGERTIFHDGTGSSLVKSIINTPDSDYFLNRIVSVAISGFEQYVKGLYAAADARQDPKQIEFGGDYTQVTITQHGLVWS